MSAVESCSANSSNKDSPFCYHCSKSVEKIYNCSRCKFEKYCSKECQLVKQRTNYISDRTNGDIDALAYIAYDGIRIPNWSGRGRMASFPSTPLQ